MAITVYSAQVVGLDAQPISVEVDITPGLHLFSIVGLADKEVQESRERISAAMKNIGALAPHKNGQRVIVNLAPADIKKGGPSFDLPIAIGYLLASGQVIFDPKGIMFLGELGLDGSVRKISGLLPVALAARTAGFRTLIVPKGNGAEAALLEELEVHEVQSLGEVIEYLSGRTLLTPLPKTAINTRTPKTQVDFKDIKGQEGVKRALEIAAAGGHNVLLSGPPGGGKTVLARALPGILPPLSFEEALELTKIYSVSGLLSGDEPFVSQRPFRSPHHSASSTSITGGGTSPRPGEVTLAHHGVFFADEFPEFDRRVIESLRQPLEERTVTVTRVQGAQTFPASFMLVAAMNPCPCGNHGNPTKDCICTPGAVTKYKKKISGPMLDRIDIHIETPAVTFEKLESQEEGEPSETVRQRVLKARDVQAKRFHGLSISTNSGMGINEIKKFIPVGENLRPILKKAHERYKLSARAYHRVLKLARTIADLAGAEHVEENHILEALQYRPKEEV